MIADSITVSRIVFSVILYFLSPATPLFAVLYVLCGVSDMTDGYVARKRHTESRHGAVLDSVADVFFAIAYTVKILPLLALPLWIWIWTLGIALVKTAGILRNSIRSRHLCIRHSPANKITGLCLFLLPPFAQIADAACGAAVVCAVATVAAVEEHLKEKTYSPESPQSGA